MIYLDYNATTPVLPEVKEAMLPYLGELYGNASTVYQVGQKARKGVEEAREALAAFIGTDDLSELIFTSCATESNNMAIKGVLESYPGKNRVVSSAIEHSSVRTVLQHLSSKGKIESVVCPVSPDGVVNVDEIKSALTPNTALVSVMAVNNEVGTLQPIQEISKLCRAKNIPFHVDAVQAAGKIPIRVDEWDVDLLSLSAHKFGGPKGVGLLYIRKGTRMEALLHGGSHEKNRRAGTENVPGIIGMGEAARQSSLKMDEKNKRIQTLREKLESSVIQQIPKTFINGLKAERVSNTTNICFDYCDSSALLMALDLSGLACSNGSACSTGSVEASHVLLAMGLPQDKAHASLRFSLGQGTTEAEIDQAIGILKEKVSQVRETHPLWKEAANH